VFGNWAFLLGCLAGAIAAKLAGLSLVAGAALALLALALGWHRQAQQEPMPAAIPQVFK
jgi:hypothetical protein